MKQTSMRRRPIRGIPGQRGTHGAGSTVATYVNRQGRTLKVLLEIHDDPRPDAILVALEAFAATELFVSSAGTLH